jgi:hypothetical protein
VLVLVLPGDGCDNTSAQATSSLVHYPLFVVVFPTAPHSHSSTYADGRRHWFANMLFGCWVPLALTILRQDLPPTTSVEPHHVNTKKETAMIMGSHGPIITP